MCIKFALIGAVDAGERSQARRERISQTRPLHRLACDIVFQRGRGQSLEPQKCILNADFILRARSAGQGALGLGRGVARVSSKPRPYVSCAWRPAGQSPCAEKHPSTKWRGVAVQLSRSPLLEKTLLFSPFICSFVDHPRSVLCTAWPALLSLQPLGESTLRPLVSHVTALGLPLPRRLLSYGVEGHSDMGHSLQP